MEEGEKNVTSATALDILPVNVRKNRTGVTAVTELATQPKTVTRLLTNPPVTTVINQDILLENARNQVPVEVPIQLATIATNQVILHETAPREEGPVMSVVRRVTYLVIAQKVTEN